MRHNHENRTLSESRETDDSSLDPPTDETSSEDSTISKPVFGRRGYLGLLGAGVLSPLLGSQPASGQQQGYGLDEYGLSEYSGPENDGSSDPDTEQPEEPDETGDEPEEDPQNDESEADSPPNVLTVSAKREASSVTLSGLIWTLGQSESANAYFEYRPTDSESWSETDATALSRWGAFQQTLANLPPSTQYEYRSVVTINEETTVGDTKLFHTLDAEHTIFDSQ